MDKQSVEFPSEMAPTFDLSKRFLFDSNANVFVYNQVNTKSTC